MKWITLIISLQWHLSGGGIYIRQRAAILSSKSMCWKRGKWAGVKDRKGVWIETKGEGASPKMQVLLGVPHLQQLVRTHRANTYPKDVNSPWKEKKRLKRLNGELKWTCLGCVFQTFFFFFNTHYRGSSFNNVISGVFSASAIDVKRSSRDKRYRVYSNPPSLNLNSLHESWASPGEPFISFIQNHVLVIQPSSGRLMFQGWMAQTWYLTKLINSQMGSKV